MLQTSNQPMRASSESPTATSADGKYAKLLRCVPSRVRANYVHQGDLLLEKQERPVAILFADIEGCTRLCEDLSPRAMDDVVVAHFSSHFDAIESAGGTVNEIMGDGFMAIFDEGRPPDQARAAASAALAIRGRTSELNAIRPADHDPIVVNIGIHAGLALVGFTIFRTPSGERWTWTASGPVTNIASRLCALATGGSILVSEEIARNLRPTGHALESLGPQRLKNVGQPVATFRLRG